VAALALVVSTGTPAGADERNSAAPPRLVEPVTPRVELRYDLRIDVPVTAGIGAGILTWALVRADVLGSSCTWCDPAGDVNGLDAWFRDALRRRDVQPAATTSNILSFGVAPAGIAGLTFAAAAADKRVDETPVNLLLVAEGTMSAVLVSETLKPFLLRERPDVHFLSGDAREAALADGKNEPLLAFPSGHAGTTFALTGAAGTVASMRGYRLAPMIWVAGLMLGVATSYTRMAADRHYFTDILGGTAIGLVVGAGVPWLFHKPTTRAAELSRIVRSTMIATTEVRGGRMVSLGWSF
jgi:membrane-associated phospholipid phosphatase